ncbi:helix-turn-helix transcriptional regulator [Nocardia sp. JMUB6875]
MTAGLHIDLSPQSIGRIEDGQKVKLSTGQIRDLLDLYDVPDSGGEREEVLGLWQEVGDQAQAAKLAGTTKGWWQAYTDQYAPHFDHYLSLEAVANRLTTHQTVLLPGLLQTTGYRRAVSRIAYPNHSSVDIDRRVELAAHRQVRLADNNFRVNILLSEAVIRQTPGGPAVMVEQLEHILQVATTRSNVSIRVVPLRSGSHLGLIVQSFTLLEFPPLANHLIEPPVVYVEGFEGALYLERTDMIDRHRQAINDIQRVALSEDDTKQLVQQIAKECTA